MNPYLFLLVVVSLGCGSLPPRETIDVYRCLAASSGLWAGWTLLSLLASRNLSLAARRGDLDPLQAAKLHEKITAAFGWLGLVVVGLIHVGFGWASMGMTSGWAESSRFLQACWLLAPAMTICLSQWTTEHAYGVQMGYVAKGTRPLLDAWGHSFRSGIAWLTVPILLLMALADGISLLPGEPWLAESAVPIAVLLFVVLLLPLALRIIFRTSPIRPDQQEWVASLLRASGIHRIRIRRWETGGSTYNALVAGFVPPVRTLLISDRILDELPTHQVAMIVLHEAAHVRRRHMPLRILAVVPAWAIGFGVGWLCEPSPWAQTIGLIAGVAATMAILLVVAHRTEHDADIWACRQAESLAAAGIRGVPDDAIQAAECLATALRRVTFGGDPNRSTWLHPSVRKRITVMREATSMNVTGGVAAALPIRSGVAGN
ncbi:MAG: M48 family metalloprotease [Planctomycetota bacterium]